MFQLQKPRILEQQGQLHRIKSSPQQKKVRKSRSPDQRLGKSHDHTDRTSSRDRRSSSEDKDVQEFIKILAEDKPGNDEKQNGEF